MIPYFDGVRFGIEDYESRGEGVFAFQRTFIDLVGSYAYYWSSKGSLSPLHEWMLDQVVSMVPPASDFERFGWGTGLRVPDLIAGGIYYEVESGLKKTYSDLVARLHAWDGHFTYVIVPNPGVKRRYLADLPRFRGRLLTLLEFSHEF